MTTEELQAIQERVEKASPGKWTMKSIESISPFGNTTFFRVMLEKPFAHHKGKIRKYVAHSMLEDDAIFVANARQDIPFLLAEIERLQDEVLTTIKMRSSQQ